MRLTAYLILAALPLVAQSPEGMKERTGMRNLRYCEVLVVQGSLLNAKANVYNTVGLNDCPAAEWAKLDANKLKAERKASSVILNGPRYFMMDRNALKRPGPVDRFGSLQMRLLAQVEITPLTQKRTPYTENTVERESQYVFEKGKKVYELTAPNGKTYVMQSYSLEVDRGLTEAGLSDLGRKLKLPKGWKFQAIQADQDLVVRNKDGKAHVLQDDLKNSYQLLQ